VSPVLVVKAATVAGLSMAKQGDRLSRALHPQGRNEVEDGKRPVSCCARKSPQATGKKPDAAPLQRLATGS